MPNHRGKEQELRLNWELMNLERKRKKCKKGGKEGRGEGEGIGGARERICSGGEMLSSRRGFHTISTVGTDSSS